MRENKKHFLDTSVILTGLTKWKKEELYSRANQYFDDKEFKRLTSIRVFSEAESVMNNSRRICTQLLQKLFEESLKINAMNIQNSMILYANQLFKKEFEQKIATSYIEMKSEEIFSAINSGHKKFQEYLDTIRNEITRGLMELLILCQPKQEFKISRYDKCPTDYSTIYPTEFTELEKIIQYQNDTEVILDSYYIAKKISKNISLITLDKKHILSNKEHIEAILKPIKVCDFRQY